MFVIWRCQFINVWQITRRDKQILCKDSRSAASVRHPTAELNQNKDDSC